MQSAGRRRPLRVAPGQVPSLGTPFSVRRPVFVVFSYREPRAHRTEGSHSPFSGAVAPCLDRPALTAPHGPPALTASHRSARLDHPGIASTRMSSLGA